MAGKILFSVVLMGSITPAFSQQVPVIEVLSRITRCSVEQGVASGSIDPEFQREQIALFHADPQPAGHPLLRKDILDKGSLIEQGFQDLQTGAITVIRHDSRQILLNKPSPQPSNPLPEGYRFRFDPAKFRAPRLNDRNIAGRPAACFQTTLGISCKDLATGIDLYTERCSVKEGWCTRTEAYSVRPGLQKETQELIPSMPDGYAVAHLP